MPAIDRDGLERLLAGSSFHAVLGLALHEFDPASSSVTLRISMSPGVERTPRSGQYHGGVIASLIDIAGDFALIATLGHGVPTINLRVDYLRQAAGPQLFARATVRRAGRTVGVVDIEVADGERRLVALGRGCYGTQAG
jgi:uncharacterized protein (TIGR00369 family)